MRSDYWDLPYSVRMAIRKGASDASKARRSAGAVAAKNDEIEALAQSNRRLREGLDLPISWELSWGEVSDEEGADCGWRVHERSGNRSDREWTLIATGETPIEALIQARAALKDNGHGDAT